MTREEARNHLAEWLDEKMWRCFGTIDREAISIAVEALQFAEHFDLLMEFQSRQEVVRCKDCRHGEHIQIPIWENRDIYKAPSQFHDFIKCHKFHIKGFNETLYLGDDDYCSYGERREESEVEE